MEAYLTQVAIADELLEGVSDRGLTAPSAADVTAYADRMATRMLER